jgi:DNA-binding GntR family transcriptional regulator
VPSPQSRRSRAPTLAVSNGRVDNVRRVYEELRGLIVSGELPAGARIAERTVAERLQMSRTPVRSALHRLQQEGFVSSYGRGAEQRLAVTPLTRADGEEVFLLVGHLEGLAAHKAALLPTATRKALVARLRAVNRELAAEARKRSQATRTFELDLEFHRTYVEGVAGPRVVTLHRAIKPQAERYARLYVRVLLDQLPISVREHEAIVKAIQAGDAHGAQQAVETNWHNAAERLGRIIEEHGERGSWHLGEGRRGR